MKQRTVGSLLILSGAGDPTGSVEAPTGSIFMDYENGDLYVKTDVSWNKVNL